MPVNNQRPARPRRLIMTAVCTVAASITVALLVVVALPRLTTNAGVLTVTANPSSGLAGSTTKVSGAGWISGLGASNYHMHWDSKVGTLLGSFNPAPSGTWSTNITIPGNATPGLHHIWACQGTGEFQECAPTPAPFTVTSPPTPTPGGPPTPTPTVTPVNVPPNVVILGPTGTTITTPYVEVQIRVTEDNDLDTVTAEVVHTATSTQAGAYEFCGTTFSLDRFCPSGPPFPIVYDRLSLGGISLSLPGGLKNGTYQIRVTACDGKAQCDTATRNFALALPAPTPTPIPAVPFKVEINQGVKSVPCRSLGTVTCETGLSSIDQPPGIAGKDTVVRYYLFGQGGPRPDFSGALDLFVWRADGTTLSRTIQPNIVASAGSTTPLLANVPPDPGSDPARYRKLLEMRADPSTTLNFVIDGTLLQGADRMQVILRSGGSAMTGGVQLELVTLRLGLIIVKDPRVTFGNPTKTDFEVIRNSLLPFLRGAYPVSEVRVLRQGLARVGNPFGDSCDMMNDGWWAFGGDDVLARFPTDDPHWTATLMILPFGAGGCAERGDPDDNDDRYTLVASTEPNGNVAAQEIAHLMGLIHASCSHRECAGDQVGEASWPWPRHGTGVDVGIGSYYDDFGVIPKPATASGLWTVWLVDPCPVPDFDSRRPVCTADLFPSADTLTHDFMSYGGLGPPVGLPIASREDMWVSSITYNRIYNIIRNRAPGGHPGPAGVVARVEALLVGGIVRQDGTAELRPLLRKALPAASVNEISPGPYTLQLLGANDAVLYERTFDLRTATHSTTKYIREIVPYVEGLRRVRVIAGATVLLDEGASSNVPTVRVTSPNGGEVLSSGVHAVTWESSDPDGDPLTFLVQYSPDGGSTWESLALLDDNGPFQTSLDADMSTAGNRGIVRVTASDGLNTAIDASDCPFSLGADAGTPAPCQPQPTPTPPPTATPGDANCDRSVNAIDAALVLQFAAGLVTTLPCQDSTDANRDGTANAIDAALILQYSAGLLPALPPGSAGRAFAGSLARW